LPLFVGVVKSLVDGGVSGLPRVPASVLVRYNLANLLGQMLGQRGSGWRDKSID